MHLSLITGVSRGLGAELLTQLHLRGDRVVGIGRGLPPNPLDRVELVESDLARPATLPDRDAFAELLAGAGGAALIHNAGVVEPIGAVGTLPPDQLADAVTVNLTAPMLLTNAFLAALPPGLPATILFISSGATRRLIDGWAAYSATKRAGEAFFEAVAAQLADRPEVRVVSANPGVMDTGMQATVRRAAAGPGWFPEGERFQSLHEQGQLPDPATVAARLIAEHLSPVTVE